MTSDERKNIEIFIADQIDHGNRLDKWLSSHSELSRSRLRALIESGQVEVDGKKITNPSAKVVVDATYTIKIPEPVAAEPIAENIPLNVVHEDDDIIVVDKSAGMTVHPAPGHSSGTLVNALLFHSGDSLSGIGGVLRPGIVHRIDKDTSGLLVIAKNDKAHQFLSNQFAKHSVTRSYICFVRNSPKPSVDRVESRLARSPNNRKKQSVVRGTWGDMHANEIGRHAITNYKFIKGYGQKPKTAIGTPLVSKVECRLETGRTHQIRVHMAHLGCPLIGDPLYGNQKALKTSKDDNEIQLREFLASFNRQALHAQTLGFIHPTTRTYMDFHSNLPEDIQKLEDLLEKLV